MARRLKQILLGVLLLAAGYIWCGNLSLLFPSTVSQEKLRQAGSPSTLDATSPRRITFREPIVNPFLHAAAATEATPHERAAASNDPVPLPEKLQLVGVLRLGPSSQAVLRVDPQTTKTFALGEQLGEWTLMEVTDEAAVFGAGKARDTLQLAGSASIDEQ